MLSPQIFLYSPCFKKIGLVVLATPFFIAAQSVYGNTPTGFGATTVEALQQLRGELDSFNAPLISYMKDSEYLISNGLPFDVSSSVLDAAQKPIFTITPEEKDGQLIFSIKLAKDMTIGVLDNHSEIILTPHDISENHIEASKGSNGNIKPKNVDVVSSWSCEIKNIRQIGLYSGGQDSVVAKAMFSVAGGFWSTCSIVNQRPKLTP
jgi:hypothetical protein